MLRSLLHHHHPDRDAMRITLLDNGSTELERLDQFRALGVEVAASGYGLDHQVTTHGEVLAAAVLDRPDCDGYLFLDSDVCFRTDRTIEAMAAELDADPELFGVQARWLRAEDDSEFAPEPGPPVSVGIQESVRGPGETDWPPPLSYQVLRHTDADRIHPFCALVRNSPVFRRTVQTFGLSPAMVQAERRGHCSRTTADAPNVSWWLSGRRGTSHTLTFGCQR